MTEEQEPKDLIEAAALPGIGSDQQPTVEQMQKLQEHLKGSSMSAEEFLEKLKENARGGKPPEMPKKMNPIPGFSLADPDILRQLAKPGCRKCGGRGHTGMILQISGDTVDSKGNKTFHVARKLEKPVPNQCSCIGKTLRNRISFDTKTKKITIHKD